jgi:hypothetical protein
MQKPWVQQLATKRGVVNINGKFTPTRTSTTPVVTSSENPRSPAASSSGDDTDEEILSHPPVIRRQPLHTLSGGDHFGDSNPTLATMRREMRKPMPLNPALLQRPSTVQHQAHRNPQQMVPRLSPPLHSSLSLPRDTGQYNSIPSYAVPPPHHMHPNQSRQHLATAQSRSLPTSARRVERSESAHVRNERRSLPDVDFKTGRVGPPHSHRGNPSSYFDIIK